MSDTASPDGGRPVAPDPRHTVPTQGDGTECVVKLCPWPGFFLWCYGRAVVQEEGCAMNGRTHGSRTTYGISHAVGRVLLISAVVRIHASAATDPRLHGHLNGLSAVSATDAGAVGESL